MIREGSCPQRQEPSLQLNEATIQKASLMCCRVAHPFHG